MKLENDRKTTSSRNISDVPPHRVFVGPYEMHDIASAIQFTLITSLGLREHHYLIDIGCGSLRAGRLLIPYLLPGRYFGIEPETWLIKAGIENEIGQDLIRIKEPVFNNDTTFTLSAFNQKFDYLLAQSIFTHTPATQISCCLSEARKVMTTQSIFAATFFIGEENYTGNDWVYPDAVYYTLSFIKSLVEGQGLACKRIDWPHQCNQTWIIITDPSIADYIAGE